MAFLDIYAGGAQDVHFSETLDSKDGALAQGLACLENVPIASSPTLACCCCVEAPSRPQSRQGPKPPPAPPAPPPCSIESIFYGSADTRRKKMQRAMQV
ncbi:hypothetical protein VTP01DRAFT_8848 [Rhizomucor pusillus]|uniref:uncharacterized protein n=1 Tax=Rhizomucor pusillus TaxID=4840 RepID=UPI00374472D5